ncbi:hypothetical protein CEXT_286971 [Caerostris extrusa]|uniref:Uncharacterized protein n=1 Tax=Caerostris extrusa TaxID=172846 RepID=A0AAV4VE07_CAEEX|nr:hypothetical protein CEXT_286971 [Caerostris extrusa]
MNSTEYCDSEQNPESDESRDIHPETKKEDAFKHAYRYRHFRRKPRHEGVTETIGWRQHFVQVLSNVVKRFRNIGRN